MRTKILILFFLTFSISFAQIINTESFKEYPLDADHFVGTDVLGQVYFIKNNILYKKSRLGILSYSNVNYGKLYSVNIQDPFKIILFYREFNSVVLLDNRLNELTPAVTFPDINLTLVGYAPENNLWIYSKDDNILQLYDYRNKNIRLTSHPLSFYQDGFLAKNLVSTNENVWLGSDRGILHFNQYLNFIGIDPEIQSEKIFPYKKGIIVKNNTDLFYLENGKKTPVSLKIDDPEAEVYFNKGVFYVFACHILYHYQIK